MSLVYANTASHNQICYGIILLFNSNTEYDIRKLWGNGEIYLRTTLTFTFGFHAFVPDKRESADHDCLAFYLERTQTNRADRSVVYKYNFYHMFQNRVEIILLWSNNVLYSVENDSWLHADRWSAAKAQSESCINRVASTADPWVRFWSVLCLCTSWTKLKETVTNCFGEIWCQ